MFITKVCRSQRLTASTGIFDSEQSIRTLSHQSLSELIHIQDVQDQIKTSLRKEQPEPLVFICASEKTFY